MQNKEEINEVIKIGDVFTKEMSDKFVKWAKVFRDQAYNEGARDMVEKIKNEILFEPGNNAKLGNIYKDSFFAIVSLLDNIKKEYE